MGKTLGAILAIGAAIAVNVIPGVGQAISASIFSATVGTIGLTAAATLANIVGFGIVAGVTAVGLTQAASLLAHPQKPTSTTTSVKTANPPRVKSGGRRRLYPAYAFFQTNGDGIAGDVYPIHDCPLGPIDGFEAFFLGNDQVAIATGVVAGLPDGSFGSGTVEIDARSGHNVETAYSQMISLFPGVWTSTRRGDSICSAMVSWQPVKSSKYQKVYPKGQPSLSIVARWLRLYDWRDSSQSLTDPLTWKWTENATLLYVYYMLVDEGRQPRNPVTLDGASVNPAWQTEIAEILQEKWDRWFSPTLDYWTAAADDADVDMLLTGFRCLTSAEVKHGSSSVVLANPLGLVPGGTFTLTASDDLTHSEELTVTSISGGTVHFSPSLDYDHPLGSLASWSSTDDFPIYEKRYRQCVSWESTANHANNKTAILQTFDGWVCPRYDGALVIYSGRYVAPTIAIGPDAIVDFTIENGVDDESACNEIVLTSVSAEHYYNTPECEPWRDEDDIDTRGRVASQTFDPQVPSYTQARRLGKRIMSKIMAPRRGTITGNYLARAAKAQRYVTLHIREFGRDTILAPVEITGFTDTTTGATFTWVEADPNVDEWNPATEEGLPAPVGNVASPGALGQPVISAATANFGTDITTGQPGVFVDVTADGPDRDDLTWYIRTRQQGYVNWGTREYDDIPTGSSVDLSSEFVPTDAMVEVEVSYSTGDGTQSDWSATATVNTSSANVPPAKVTGLSAAAGVGQATLQWNNPTSGNLAKERLYGSTSPTFSSATQIGGDYTDAAGTASSHIVTRTAGTWNFWVTTISSGGVEGNPVGPVTATVT